MTATLLGRRSECAALDRLLRTVRSGRSHTVVLRGEAGIGKTALLDYLVGRTAGFRVLRAAGVQSEMELAYAGLHQLCAPFLGLLDHLPDAQGDALRMAFGLRAGRPPDHFLVGLAVLGLLAEVAKERPLVAVIDDAQWLDRASATALAFAARRLVAESVALVFAAREETAELAGLSPLVVDGLSPDDARTLLRSVVTGPVDERVFERVVAETRGNPLALLELPGGLDPVELSVGFRGPGARALPDRIEESYRRRLSSLPHATQQLVLVAAAEPLGDPVLVWRAVEQLGIGVDAATPAAAAGLLEIGVQVRFRHPLVRSAIYHSASPARRRVVHRVLADATDPETDPDRRAWHDAHAASGPDEEVAAELERSAGRAQTRGGPAAAAAFLQRATELTPTPARRSERALAAAHAAQLVGLPDTARKMLSIVDAGPLDELQHARVRLLRAQIAFTTTRGTDAALLLLDAANRLRQLDPARAREAYLDAFSAVQFARPRAGSGAREVAEAVRAAPPPPQPHCPADLLLDGVATQILDGHHVAAPTLRRAISAFIDPAPPGEDCLRWLWHANITAADLGDDEAWLVLADRAVHLARNSGALSELPLALTARITAHVLSGELTEAESALVELRTVSEMAGSPVTPYGALMLAAWQGRETEAADMIDATRHEMLRRGEGAGLTYISWAQAVLYNGLGRYEDALTVAKAVGDAHQPRLDMATRGLLTELVEAAARSGDIGRGAVALQVLTDITLAGGTDWALGLAARSHALLSERAVAETAYREAIDRLGRTRMRGELARAHLLFGEWLRRERRRVDAREQLRTAHTLFADMGADAFAQRAARELRATGETARRRTTQPSGELTAQEAQIVRLVGQGLSNQQVAARLFISPRTVEWHLRRIFGKLQISSRRQLYS